MDQVDRALAEFDARRSSSAPSKIDALLEVKHLPDARVVPFLIQVARDPDELPEVHVHVVRVLRSRHLETGERSSVAHTIGHVLSDGSTLVPRAQAALALAEFTDVEGVIRMLGTVALDDAEPLDSSVLGIHVARARRAAAGMHRGSSPTRIRRDAGAFGPQGVVNVE